MTSISEFEPGGEDRRKARGPDLRRGAVDVIGHAHIGERIALLVVQGITGGGHAVARLADGSYHREPAAPLQQWNVSAGNRREGAELCVGTEMINLGHMHVAAERHAT